MGVWVPKQQRTTWKSTHYIRKAGSRLQSDLGLVYNLICTKDKSSNWERQKYMQHTQGSVICTAPSPLKSTGMDHCCISEPNPLHNPSGEFSSIASTTLLFQWDNWLTDSIKEDRNLLNLFIQKLILSVIYTMYSSYAKRLQQQTICC